MSPSETIREFVRAVNDHDLDGIRDLLPAEHRLVDALGERVVGREETVAAWSAYFEWVPDYEIVVEQTIVRDDVVALFGRAGGSCVVDGRLRGRWTTLAAWRAEVRHGRLVRWQVYADNEPIGGLLARADC